MESEIVPGRAAKGSGGGGLGLEAHREQLIPNIPDDVTIGEIVPKLPWKNIASLAAEIPAWLHAIRSREVRDARVICRALEPLVLIRCSPNKSVDDLDRYGNSGGRYLDSYQTLGLFSIRNGFYFELPPLPVCERGIPSDCQCVTLDGKIYALGGFRLKLLLVYVLDLAGLREWKQCASMLGRKKAFGCAALDGKVYVVGCDVTGVQVSEVYDPKADTWSLIEATAFRPTACSLTVVGEELFVLSPRSGFSENSWMDAIDLMNPIEWMFADVALDLDYVTLDAVLADVYHPVKDEWREEKFTPGNGDVQSVSSIAPSILFTAKGKLYGMTDGFIFGLDMDTKTWVQRHTYSFVRLRLFHFGLPFLVIAVGDELLALHGSRGFVWLLQSEGFGGENARIEWRLSRICPVGPDGRSALPPLSCLIREMYSIEL